VGRLFNYGSVSVTSRALESKLQAKLNQTRVVYSGVDGAEARGTDVVDRHAELGVVKKVEKFCPEIQSHVLPRQRKLFDHGEVGVDEIWTYNRDTRRVSELTRRWRDEAARVNPLKLAMARGSRVAASNLVRTVEVVEIAASGEGDSGGVCAIDQRNREARSNFLNERQLPAPKQGVGDVTPITSILLAPTKRQIVNNASREAIIEIDLRQRPIQILPIRKWEEGRAKQRPQTVA
jgi:hypothetical protein